MPNSAVSLILNIIVSCAVVLFLVVMQHLGNTTQQETQSAIETAITTVRGCDIIQFIQDDKLITAFPAPDQPKGCKIRAIPQLSVKGK